MYCTKQDISSWFEVYLRKVVIAFTVIALTIFTWGGLCFNINAHAATAEGIGNQIEGKVQKDIGTKRRAVGDILDNPTEEAKGALTQAKGEVKKGLGTTQNKLDEVGDEIEDTSKSLVDSVKDIFN
ncbi:MAG: CsbD family protein [Cyanobacteria bacterium J06558_2]